MEPSLRSFLPLIRWHSYVSFTLSSKPYSCWLLLPNTRSTLPTTSPCSHVSLFFFLCSLSLTTDGFARFLDSADFLPLSPCPTLQLPCRFLREDISNSRSHTRKFSFLLITSDSSLHSSICFHFSLQRSTPPSKDRRWTRSLHTLLPSFVPLFLWLHHETGYKGGEFCCSLSWMWPLHCISCSFPLNIAKSLSTFLFSYYKCTLVFPLQKSCQP